MVALLLLATFLRFAAWQSAPPGLRYDETTVVYEADEIRAGARPIYMDGSAEEALYHYLFAAAQDFIAPHLFTLRWLSAALSLIGVAAVYALGRRMFNARVGLLAAAIATGAFWSLLYSRLGLRIIALTPFVLLAMIFLWRGFTRSRRRDFIVSGVLFGLSAYTYSATRMLPVVFVGFAIILAIFNRPFLRKHGVNFALTILTAALIVLPMAYHIATVPAAERRLGEVEGPLDALASGDVQPLINSTHRHRWHVHRQRRSGVVVQHPQSTGFRSTDGCDLFHRRDPQPAALAAASLCVRAHLAAGRTAARHVDVARGQQQSQFSGANTGFLAGWPSASTLSPLVGRNMAASSSPWC